MPVLVEDNVNKFNPPNMIGVKQIFEKHSVDVIESIRTELSKGEIRNTICPGDKVALAVGSRGIRNIDVIVKEMVNFLKERGADPVIIPAMGSHGGGIAENQKKILDSYGVNQETMCVHVEASMDTVCLGQTADGIPVYIDKLAASMDKIVVVNRVKSHTTFSGNIESGLCKMLAIGLGKHKGCSTLHRHGTEEFGKIIPSVAQLIMEKKKVAFGVAIIEDAFENIGKIQALVSQEFIAKEPELLQLSKKWMPRLYFDFVDILIVEKIGKDISGAGMDPNIVGRRHFSRTEPFNSLPIQRIIVCELSEATHGNACGIGRADFTTKKACEQIDLEFTYANCLAAGVPESGRIPMVMTDEKEAIIAAMQACDNPTPEDIRIVKIKDTLHLEEILVSDNTVDYCRKSTHFWVLGQ